MKPRFPQPFGGYEDGSWVAGADWDIGERFPADPSGFRADEWTTVIPRFEISPRGGELALRTMDWGVWYVVRRETMVEDSVRLLVLKLARPDRWSFWAGQWYSQRFNSWIFHLPELDPPGGDDRLRDFVSQLFINLTERKARKADTEIRPIDDFYVQQHADEWVDGTLRPVPAARGELAYVLDSALAGTVNREIGIGCAWVPDTGEDPWYWIDSEAVLRRMFADNRIHGDRIVPESRKGDAQDMVRVWGEREHLPGGRIVSIHQEPDYTVFNPAPQRRLPTPVIALRPGHRLTFEADSAADWSYGESDGSASPTLAEEGDQEALTFSLEVSPEDIESAEMVVAVGSGGTITDSITFRRVKAVLEIAYNAQLLLRSQHDFYRDWLSAGAGVPAPLSDTDHQQVPRGMLVMLARKISNLVDRSENSSDLRSVIRDDYDGLIEEDEQKLHEIWVEADRLLGSFNSELFDAIESDPSPNNLRILAEATEAFHFHPFAQAQLRDRMRGLSDSSIPGNPPVTLEVLAAIWGRAKTNKNLVLVPIVEYLQADVQHILSTSRSTADLDRSLANVLTDLEYQETGRRIPASEISFEGGLEGLRTRSQFAPKVVEAALLLEQIFRFGSAVLELSDAETDLEAKRAAVVEEGAKLYKSIVDAVDTAYELRGEVRPKPFKLLKAGGTAVGTVLSVYTLGNELEEYNRGTVGASEGYVTATHTLILVSAAEATVGVAAALGAAVAPLAILLGVVATGLIIYRLFEEPTGLQQRLALTYFGDDYISLQDPENDWIEAEWWRHIGAQIGFLNRFHVPLEVTAERESVSGGRQIYRIVARTQQASVGDPSEATAPITGSPVLFSIWNDRFGRTVDRTSGWFDLAGSSRVLPPTPNDFGSSDGLKDVEDFTLDAAHHLKEGGTVRGRLADTFNVRVGRVVRPGDDQGKVELQIELIDTSADESSDFFDYFAISVGYDAGAIISNSVEADNYLSDSYFYTRRIVEIEDRG